MLSLTCLFTYTISIDIAISIYYLLIHFFMWYKVGKYCRYFRVKILWGLLFKLKKNVFGVLSVSVHQTREKTSLLLFGSIMQFLINLYLILRCFYLPKATYCKNNWCFLVKVGVWICGVLPVGFQPFTAEQSCHQKFFQENSTTRNSSEVSPKIKNIVLFHLIFPTMWVSNIPMTFFLLLLNFVQRPLPSFFVDQSFSPMGSTKSKMLKMS